jgi:polyhydroxybutyrate depolymerase
MRLRTLFGAPVLAAALAGSALVGAATTTAAATTCDRPATAGATTVDVTQKGVSRPVSLWVPKGYTGGAVPLVLWLHGSSSSGEAMLATKDPKGNPYLTDDADQHGYVLAAPTGAIPFNPTPDLKGWAWNIPGVPLVGSTTYPAANAPDDVAYLSLAIDAISQALCIDASRVYATGASGGGRMASQLACDMPDRVAAVAPIMGVRTPQASDNPPRTVECGQHRAVPTLAIHGTQDPVNVFTGGTAGSSWTYSTPEALRRRSVLNGCSAAFPSYSMATAHVRHWAFHCPAGADVELYQVLDGGHTVPGSAEIPSLRSLIGPTNQELNTPDVLWSFFSRFTLG